MVCFSPKYSKNIDLQAFQVAFAQIYLKKSEVYCNFFKNMHKKNFGNQTNHATKYGNKLKWIEHNRANNDIMS